ncbi:hypothetical protein Tco_0751948 [Tanacetum coccineum]|uniref:Uncharacterized protein n=1 Tax=Tanacetum coccineum TaxID=301880 RepID=A0ABQ4Z8R1_9ASTR
MFVIMPFDNLKLCNNKDSVFGVDITSRFPVYCKSIELLTFSPLVRDALICTDIAKITRKRSKPDKHEHENEKSAQEPGTGYPMIERIQGQRSNPRGACEEDLEASSPAINRRLLSLTKEASRSSINIP